MKSPTTFIIGIIASLILISAFWYGLQQQCVVAYKHSPCLVVGTNATYPPFEFLDDNQVVGFDIDIATEISKRLNKKIVLKEMSFDALVPELLTGSLHFAVSSLTPTAEREKQVRFSKPYFVGDPFVIATLKNTPKPNSLQDLIGKTVIVNIGYTADSLVSSVPGIDVLRLDTTAEALLALQMGRGSALVTANSVMTDYIKKNKSNQFNLTVLSDTNETYAIAISPAYQEMVEPINNGLEQMEKDGTITNLKDKWLKI